MCNQRVTWGVVPKGGTTQNPVWACTQHLGYVLEILHKKDGPTYGFGYVGDQDFSKAKCVGAPTEIGVSMRAEVSVSTTPPEFPINEPKVKTSASVEVK